MSHGIRSILAGLLLLATPLFSTAIEIELAEVDSHEKVETIFSVGVLFPSSKVIIRPEISGKIVAIDFREGERVEKDDILLQFDDRVQKAVLKDAEAKYLLAKQNVDRLTAAQAGTTAQMLDTAKATLLQEEAHLEVASSDLDKMTLRAPFSGNIGLKNVELGDYIQTGTDIVSLMNTDQLKLEFSIPERVAHVARVGQEVRFSIDNYPNQEFEATVYAVSPEIQQESRSLTIRAHYNNEDDTLISGMFARLILKIPMGYQVIEVPEEAVFAAEGKHYLYRAIDDGDGYYRVELSEVTIGERTSYSVEILDGIEDGDIVVKAGQLRINDQDRVRGIFKQMGNQELPPLKSDITTDVPLADKE